MSSGVLQGAHHFVLNNPQFVERVEINQMNQMANSTGSGGKKGAGIQRLLDASMRDAFHDSCARYPPPLCHPGTRQDFIDEIISWALGTSQHTEHILWMHGPAGVGKSAVAQSCAGLLASQNKLGAALFFSRPNERDDPGRLFTSISYQIATKFDPYVELIDQRIRKDPTVVTSSIMEQFQDLLVKPLQQLRARGIEAEEWAVIVDGLDECEGRNAQCDIVEIIAASVRERVMPFRWVFLSRPEPHIVGTFTAEGMQSISRHLELPVSRKIDNEITLYLMDELRRIQRRTGLPDSWPSERDIGTLVNISAGLFIYAATIIRFVGEHNSLGPVDQLNAVLSLAACRKEKTDSGHPLSELDQFYTLIMRCVPSKVIPVIQKILLVRDIPSSFVAFEATDRARRVANVLGLSEAQYRNACSSLYSVLHLDSALQIEFYHASFMDFLQDPNRSGEFCIYSCLNVLRRELIERVNAVHFLTTGGSPDSLAGIDVTWPGSEHIDESWVHRHAVETLFKLCQQFHPLDASASSALLCFRFYLIFGQLEGQEGGFLRRWLSLEELRQNIPKDFRSQIVRRAYNPLVFLGKPKDVAWQNVYVLGCGRNKVACWRAPDQSWCIVPYPVSLFHILLGLAVIILLVFFFLVEI